MTSLVLQFERPLRAVRIKPTEPGQESASGHVEPQDSDWHDSGPSSAEQLAELQQVRQLLEQINHAQQNHMQQQAAAIQQMHVGVVQLAVAISRKIIGRSLENSSDRIVELLNEQLSEANEKQPVLIQLHPDDIQRIGDNAADDFQFAGEIQFVPNPAMQPGNCQLQSGAITLVADYERTLSEIEKRLMEALTRV